jgi:hypothetical protein
MPSTTICDYQVLIDGAFTLDAATNNRERTLHFEVPDDFAFGTGPRNLILAFKVAPMQDTVFKFLLNEREIASFNLDKSHTRTMWETFPGTTPFPEGASFQNPAPMRLIVSQGKVRFEDVVMWYQIRR